MGIFSRFEDKMEDTVDAAASRISKAPISPVQIAKKAEKQMRRETMVGAGKEYAPTLYTVLVNPDDDARLFGYYPTLAGETETYLKAKATQEGLVMDGNPLVRFIVDEGLRHGKFDVIAEAVAAPIIAQLRDEEMERYGIAQRSAAPQPQAAPPIPVEHRPPAAFPDEALDRRNADYVEDGYGYDAQPRTKAPNTIAYASGAAEDTPDFRKAQARLTDLSHRRSYDLAGNVISLGRESANDIAVDDASASRRHAELRRDHQGRWVISDLDSMNGTRVNGSAIASKALRPGDIITIGKTDFEFTTAR